MSNCQKDHLDISAIMDELPVEQGGLGRHKCAACAYELGFSDGYNRKLQISINSILENLPTSQAGSQRHKSAHLGYIRGYYDGLIKIYQELKAFPEKKKSLVDFSDVSEPLQVQEGLGPQYLVETANPSEISFNNEIFDEDLDESNSTLDILDYKISDLQNHTHYLFNDFDNKSFSNRTFNVLHAQGIITLQDILDYHGNILDLPKAGRKVYHEFGYLREYVKNLVERFSVNHQKDDETEKQIQVETSSQKVDNLLRRLFGKKLMIAEYDYKQMIDGVGNTKISFVLSKYSLQKFVRSFCYKSDEVIFKAIGFSKESFLLISFRDKLTRRLEQLSLKESDTFEQSWELISRQLPLNIQSKFRDATRQELKDYYFENIHLPIFKLLDIIFCDLSRKSKYGSCFVQKYFHNSSDFQYLEDDVSYERKRQRAQKVYEILKNRNNKISNSDLRLYECVKAYCYLLDSKEFLDYIKDTIIEKDIVSAVDINSILVEEKCLNLKSREALSIIGLALNDVFCSIGGLFNDDDSFDDIFLIKKELFNVYDFSSAVSFFRERLESQHTATEEYNLPIFVKDGFEFWFEGITKYEYVERITTVLSVLIRKELGLEDSLLMDILTLKPNTQVSLKDLVYEALKSKGSPSTPEEIIKYLEDRQSHVIPTIDDVRYYLRNDNRIVSTKFEGRFDLVANNPEIGSYRDYIRIILNESDVPLSPENIFKRLPASRKVGYDKFRSNLAVFQEVRRYIGGLYGLCNKTYDDKYILDIQNFTPGDKLAKISVFFRDNNRLPIASDGPEWKQLRHWWDSLSSRKETLTIEEQRIYTSLKAESSNPSQGSKSDLDFSIVANSIKDFIVNNRRMPAKDAKNNNELTLANWFAKQEKRMIQDVLTPKQRSIFINLLKIKSKYVN